MCRYTLYYALLFIFILQLSPPLLSFVILITSVALTTSSVWVRRLYVIMLPTALMALMRTPSSVVSEQNNSRSLWG